MLRSLIALAAFTPFLAAAQATQPEAKLSCVGRFRGTAFPGHVLSFEAEIFRSNGKIGGTEKGEAKLKLFTVPVKSGFRVVLDERNGEEVRAGVNFNGRRDNWSDIGLRWRDGGLDYSMSMIIEFPKGSKTGGALGTFNMVLVVPGASTYPVILFAGQKSFPVRCDATR